jgi:hypothetical protein
VVERPFRPSARARRVAPSLHPTSERRGFSSSPLPIKAVSFRENPQEP